MRILEINKKLRTRGNLGKNKICGAQVIDLIGDRPSLDQTCPTIKIPQEICPKLQPTSANKKNPQK